MNLAIVLKDEIRRLAQKKFALKPRPLNGLARPIAARSHNSNDSSTRSSHGMAQFSATLREGENRPAARESERSPNRFSARSVRAQRRRLRLSAAEYSQLIGVSGQTIYQWEHGNSRPRRSQMAALVAMRSIGRRSALARLAEASKK